MKAQAIFDAINRAADFSTAMDFDNPGFLVGDPQEEVRGVLCALDVTDGVIDEAVARGANVIVTHHPIIFHPLKRVTADTLVWRCIRAGLSVICAHTNLDAAAGGVNDILCGKLDLREVCLPQGGEGMLRAGTLDRGMAPAEFAYYVKQKLDLPALRYSDGGRPIRRVAVCGGAGGSFLQAALADGCQALVTGDVKHDVFLEALHRGITLVDAGHFGTEQHVVPYLAQLAARGAGEAPVAIARSNTDPSTTI